MSIKGLLSLFVLQIHTLVKFREHAALRMVGTYISTKGLMTKKLAPITFSAAVFATASFARASSAR